MSPTMARMALAAGCALVVTISGPGLLSLLALAPLWIRVPAGLILMSIGGPLVFAAWVFSTMVGADGGDFHSGFRATPPFWFFLFAELFIAAYLTLLLVDRLLQTRSLSTDNNSNEPPGRIGARSGGERVGEEPPLRARDEHEEKDLKS